MLVTMVLAAQLVLCTLAAYAFARYEFRGKDVAFVSPELARASIRVRLCVNCDGNLPGSGE